MNITECSPKGGGERESEREIKERDERERKRDKRERKRERWRPMDHVTKM